MHCSSGRGPHWARLRGWPLPGLLVLGACQRAPEPVTFAAAAPWHAVYMTMTRQGIELAVAQANAAGGIDGRPVRIRVGR